MRFEVWFQHSDGMGDWYLAQTFTTYSAATEYVNDVLSHHPRIVYKIVSIELT